MVGIVDEPTYRDRAVRGELIGLTEKGTDLLTRVIPYLTLGPAEEHLRTKTEEGRSLPLIMETTSSLIEH